MRRLQSSPGRIDWFRLGRPITVSFLAGLFASWVGGCAGYRLGPTLGTAAGTRSVQVNFFQNESFEPRLAESIATSLRRTLQQDGAFHLKTDGNADVVIDGFITEYNRSALSFSPSDIITPRDYYLTVSASVTATNRRTGERLLDRTVQGRATLRVVPDLASAEREAIPLLADDLARRITDLLVDGSW